MVCAGPLSDPGGSDGAVRNGTSHVLGVWSWGGVHWVARMESLPKDPALDPGWLEQDLCTVGSLAMGSPAMGPTSEAATGLRGTLSL